MFYEGLQTYVIQKTNYVELLMSYTNNYFFDKHFFSRILDYYIDIWNSRQNYQINVTNALDLYFFTLTGAKYVCKTQLQNFDEFIPLRPYPSKMVFGSPYSQGIHFHFR